MQGEEGPLGVAGQIEKGVFVKLKKISHTSLGSLNVYLLHSPLPKTAMPLKPRQIALVLSVACANVTCSVYFLVPSHTELGGDRGGAWSHRTVLLILAAVINVSGGVLVCTVQKRQILLITLVIGVGVVIAASDATWKCVYTRFLIVMAEFSSIFMSLSIMRKIAEGDPFLSTKLPLVSA